MSPNTPTPKPTKPRAARNIPEAAKPLSEVLDLAVAEWGLRPQLTLEWTTQPKAQTLADNLRQSLRDTSTAQDAISPTVLRLQQLDELIDGPKEIGKLKYVRKALALQYDEENDGRAYYGEFGIVKVGSAYTLPVDRAERAEALLKLVKALANPQHGLAAGKYGQVSGKRLPMNTTSSSPKPPRPPAPAPPKPPAKTSLPTRPAPFWWPCCCCCSKPTTPKPTRPSAASLAS